MPPSNAQETARRGPRRPRPGAWIGLLLTLLAAPLLLGELGSPALWEDEAETALVARVAASTGLPGPWDGVHLVTQQQGRDALVVDALGGRILWTWHPWPQHYLAAASFAVFGPSAWSARLPFALIGLATVPLFFAWRLAAWAGRSRPLALATGATLLYALSMPFLLFSRQCRYYPLLFLGAIVALWAYGALRDGEDPPRWRAVVGRGLGLGLGLAVVFYANPLTGVAFAAGLVLHAGVVEGWGVGWLRRRGPGSLARLPSGGAFATGRRAGALLAGLGLFVALAAPWLVLVLVSDVRVPSRGLTEQLLLAVSQGWRFQYVILPAVLWPPLAWLAWRHPRSRREIVLLAAVSLALLVLVPLQAPLGTARYLLPVLPLAVAVTADLLARLAAVRPLAAGVFALVLVTTNLAQALPAVPFWLARPDQAHADREAPWLSKLAWHGRPDVPLLRFLADPGGPRDGPVTAQVEALEALAHPPRLVVAGYAWDSLRFHLGVVPGTVAPGTPVVPPGFQARARERLGLPPVDPATVDVIIPRRGWPEPRLDPAYDPTLGAEFVEIVLDVPDAAYENIPDPTARRLGPVPLPPVRLWVRRSLVEGGPGTHPTARSPDQEIP